MNRNKVKLIVIIIMLALPTLACTFYSVIGDYLGEDGCDASGGNWVIPYSKSSDPYCEPPSKDSQPNSQPVEDKQDEGDGQELSENRPSDQFDSELECNGSSIVTITVGDPETTKQGHCRYLVHYKNRSASKDVYIYHFDTHTNTSTGLNQEWYREAALFAGNDYSEYQTIFASGETSVAERVAIMFTTAACSWVVDDNEGWSLDLIAQELANPCR